MGGGSLGGPGWQLDRAPDGGSTWANTGLGMREGLLACWTAVLFMGVDKYMDSTHEDIVLFEIQQQCMGHCGSSGSPPVRVRLALKPTPV